MAYRREKMTRFEVLEKYGDLPLRFSSYYKYSFTFSGIAPDGAKISADVGGDASDIYRLDVTPNTTRTLQSGDLEGISVMVGDETIFSEWK
jgi:hypothetical protein